MSNNKKTIQTIINNNGGLCQQYNNGLLRSILMTLTTLAVCCTLFVFCLVVMVCDSYYFYQSDDNPTNGFCLPIYEKIFPSKHHKGFPMWPSTIILSILLLLLPSFILLVPMSVVVKNPLLHTNTTNKGKKTNGSSHTNNTILKKGNKDGTTISRWQKLRVTLFKGGDPIIWVWAMITIVIPISIVLWVMSQKSGGKSTGVTLFIGRYANPAGYCATIALALFMVPVAKQSPLLAAIGWSPIQALGLHVWAGRVCWLMTLLHGGLYVIQYGHKKSKNDDGKSSFWKNVISGMVPGSSCWTVESLSAFQSGSHCYRPWRNFTGVIAGTALILLIMTSWNFIRRWNYRFFYVSHILFGSMMLLFSIFHFYWIALYLMPGIIYYLACSMPIVVQQAANYFLDGGTMLKESRILGSSNGCMELTFAKSPASIRPIRQMIVPAYVRICVPELSMMWHPFTIPHTDETHKDELKLLIRRYGFFTTALYNRLQQSSKPPPTILVDGYYQGTDWYTSALEHDCILMVSGGIGVTPMLPFLQLLYQHMNNNNNAVAVPQRTKTVSFHWYCRDEGLIRHVLKEYLTPLFEKFVEEESNNEVDDETETRSHCHFKILIHLTAKEADCPEPFIIDSNDKYDEEGGKFPLGSNDDNDNCETSLSSTEEEFFNDEPDLRKENDDSSIILSSPKKFADPIKDIIFNYATNSAKNTTATVEVKKKGKPMKTASFSHLGESRWIVFTGTLVFIVTFIIYMYWYMTEVQEHTNRVFFRGYSLYAIVLFLLISAIVTEACKRIKCRSSSSSHSQLLNDDKSEREEGTNNTTTMTTRPFLQFPMEGRLGMNSTIYFDISNGRPFINDVVHSVVEAELPGAYFCGPHALLKSVQKEISSERIRVRGRTTPKCCFYQEHFEM